MAIVDERKQDEILSEHKERPRKIPWPFSLSNHPEGGIIL